MRHGVCNKLNTFMLDFIGDHLSGNLGGIQAVELGRLISPRYLRPAVPGQPSKSRIAAFMGEVFLRVDP